jgi:hypothetical protein
LRRNRPRRSVAGSFEESIIVVIPTSAVNMMGKIKTSSINKAVEEETSGIDTWKSEGDAGWLEYENKLVEKTLEMTSCLILHLLTCDLLVK